MSIASSTARSIAKPLVRSLVGVGSVASANLLLDAFPGAAAAYAGTLLSAAWEGGLYAGTPTATAWKDQSGNGRDLAATGEPTITSNGLSFDGVADYVSALFTLAQPFTIFVKLTAGTYDALQNAGLNTLLDGFTNNTITLRRSSATVADIYAGAFLTQTLPIADDETVLLTILMNGANSKVWKNGTLHAEGNAGSAAADGLIVGAMSGNLRYAQQLVHSLVLYASDKTADRAAIEALLD